MVYIYEIHLVYYLKMTIIVLDVQNYYNFTIFFIYSLLNNCTGLNHAKYIKYKMYIKSIDTYKLFHYFYIVNYF